MQTDTQDERAQQIERLTAIRYAQHEVARALKQLADLRAEAARIEDTLQRATRALSQIDA
jgi:hypothetical protein